MITIFHGDNPSESRKVFLEYFNQFSGYEPLHLDPKSINLDQINNFLQGGSLLPGKKVLAIDNFFSITKTSLDKLIKIFNQNDTEIVLWQDKSLNASQLKLFPKAKIHKFKADSRLFDCLDTIKPHQLSSFNRLYDIIIDQNLFDLFLYLLKANLRRQLQGYSSYDRNILKKIYLQIIELEFQFKTGQLSLSKELALKRVLLPLLR